MSFVDYWPLTYEEALDMLKLVAEEVGLEVKDNWFAEDNKISIKIETTSEMNGQWKLTVEFLPQVTQQEMIQFLSANFAAIKGWYKRSK